MNAIGNAVQFSRLYSSLLAVLIGTGGVTRGATLTWDTVINGAAIDEGGGAWNYGDSVWNTGGANVIFGDYNNSGADIIFGGSPAGANPSSFSVNLGGVGFQQAYNANIHSITFNGGALYSIVDFSNGYSKLSLSGSGEIVANVNASIGVKVEASSINISGPGILTLNGNERTSASLITVGDGRVVVSGGEDTLYTDELRITSPSGSVTFQGGEQFKNAGLLNISAGTLNLNYSGTENIGSLSMTGGAINGSGRLSVAAGNSFNVSEGTINANLQNSGPFNKQTAGTAILGGDNSGYSGKVNVNAGTLQVGAGGSAGKLGSGSVTIASGATLAINRSDSAYTLGNTITGGGKVAYMGTGRITVSGQNSYTGGTLLGGGTMVVASAGALPLGGEVVFNGGTLELNNRDLTSGGTLGALTLTANSTLLLDSANTTHGSMKFSGAAWTAGTLDIRSWAGLPGQAGTDDRIFFVNAPDSSVREHFRFLDGNGAVLGYGADILPSGELVPGVEPVPEPVNVALAIFGVSVAGIKFIRRSRRATQNSE